MWLCLDWVLQVPFYTINTLRYKNLLVNGIQNALNLLHTNDKIALAKLATDINWIIFLFFSSLVLSLSSSLSFYMIPKLFESIPLITCSGNLQILQKKYKINMHPESYSHNIFIRSNKECHQKAIAFYTLTDTHIHIYIQPSVFVDKYPKAVFTFSNVSKHYKNK